jgi:hypothetical protein
MVQQRFARLVRYAKPVAALVLVLVALAVLPRVGAQSRASAQASSAAASTFTCTPVGVAAFTNRVHVRCSTAAPPGGIYWFAVSTADSASASRFLSIFTTAMVTGRNVRIWYSTSDTSGGEFGCLVSDCRRATGAEVLP